MTDTLKTKPISGLVDWILGIFVLGTSAFWLYKGQSLVAFLLACDFGLYLLAMHSNRCWARSLDDQVKLIDALDEANAMLQMYERLCQSQEEQSK